MDIIFKLEHGNEKVTNFRIAEAVVDTCNDYHLDLNAEVIARMILLQIDHQRNIEFNEFGKTVFSTREEVEQALKGGAE